MIVTKAYTNNSTTGIYLDSETHQFLFRVFTSESGDNPYEVTSANNLLADVGQWYHVAGTFRRGGNLSLYVNGSMVGSVSAGEAPLFETEVPARIGCYNNSEDGSQSRGFFPGTIDSNCFRRAPDARAWESHYEATK